MTAARPILFSAPMIRALLEGRKTQTRRLAKFVARDGANLKFSGITANRLTPSTWALVSGGAGGCWNELTLPWRCPYGESGELLWVRESYYLTDDGHNEVAIYAADEGDAARHVNDVGDIAARHGFSLDWLKRHTKRRPGIHMPRWASRLTLKITGVKVERLQDISEADAIAEGVTRIRDACHVIKGFDYDHSGLCHTSAVTPYYKLWEHLNGPGSWDANPFVVALTFDVHKANVDTVLASLTKQPEPTA